MQACPCGHPFLVLLHIMVLQPGSGFLAARTRRAMSWLVVGWGRGVGSWGWAGEVGPGGHTTLREPRCGAAAILRFRATPS